MWDTPTHRTLVAEDIREIVEAVQQDPSSRRFSKQLIERAHSSYEFEAAYATSAVGNIGDAASPFILDLAALMRSDSPVIRREAALSLAKLGPRSEPALPLLKKRIAMGHTDDTTWFAAEAIGNIGKPAVHCLPLLYDRLGAGPSQFDDSLYYAIEKLEEIKAREDLDQ